VRVQAARSRTGSIAGASLPPRSAAGISCYSRFFAHFACAQYHRFINCSFITTYHCFALHPQRQTAEKRQALAAASSAPKRSFSSLRFGVPLRHRVLAVISIRISRCLAARIFAYPARRKCGVLLANQHAL